MGKINKSIEIVRSNMPGMSSLAKRQSESIRNVLKRRYSKVRTTNIDTELDLQELAMRKPDLVFLGMKFLDTDDNGRIWISQYMKTRELGIRVHLEQP